MRRPMSLVLRASRPGRLPDRPAPGPITKVHFVAVRFKLDRHAPCEGTACRPVIRLSNRIDANTVASECSTKFQAAIFATNAGSSLSIVEAFQAPSPLRLPDGDDHCDH